MTQAPTTQTETPTDTSVPAETATPRPAAAPTPAAKPDAGGFIWGTGRRKTSVARVRIKPGEGKFQVNGREVDEYFTEPQHRNACRRPLQETNTAGSMDVFVKVHGGGITGQAEAILLGVARALKAYDPGLEEKLRDEGLLTRDPREVERKKYGQRGARRRFQFSKR